MYEKLFVLLFSFLIIKTQWITITANTCETPDKQTGFCIPIRTCKTITNFLETLTGPLSQDIKKKLKAYQCGVIQGRPKVCCPPKPISLEKPDKDTLEELQFPDVSQHPNLKLISKNCGHLDTVMKIVNGNSTSLFEFPWMALLSYQTSRGPEFRCGGSIINEKYVLTAAHCVANLEKTREKLKLIGVRVGEHDIRTDKDCEEEDGEEICAPPVQDLAIQQVIVHKSYNSISNVNDIALLRVSTINLNEENSRPVCLPFDNTGNFNYTNRRVVVTGWGYTELGRPSPVLLKAELPVSPLQECNKKYQNIYKVNEKQLCAGGVGNFDSCGGDSGGPLHSLEVLHGEPRFIQQGIVSFGPKDCGQLPIPGVYTRVASYIDWILDNIKP